MAGSVAVLLKVVMKPPSTWTRAARDARDSPLKPCSLAAFGTCPALLVTMALTVYFVQRAGPCTVWAALRVAGAFRRVTASPRRSSDASVTSVSGLSARIKAFSVLGLAGLEQCAMECLKVAVGDLGRSGTTARQMRTAADARTTETRGCVAAFALMP